MRASRRATGMERLLLSSGRSTRTPEGQNPRRMSRQQGPHIRWIQVPAFYDIEGCFNQSLGQQLGGRHTRFVCLLGSNYAFTPIQESPRGRFEPPLLLYRDIPCRTGGLANGTYPGKQMN
jgi:hypothetical protein